MNKFFLIDKPLWITSFDVIRVLKKKLQIKRIGHTWTLDPLASWLLLIAVWNYTKLIPYFEKDTKVYDFEVSLNWKTASYDAETPVEYISEEKQEYFKNNLKKEDIENILRANFSWVINQLPPKYSALKINWNKALDLVRDWVEFELKTRNIEIFSIEILNYNYPLISLRAKVSAWTYIRSIWNDLWVLLWTWWFVTKLRRVEIWNLSIDKSITLEDFDENKSLNIEEILDKNRFLKMDEYMIGRFNNWLVTNTNISLEENTDYFVTSDNINITNIIKYQNKQIIPIRKI